MKIKDRRHTMTFESKFDFPNQAISKDSMTSSFFQYTHDQMTVNTAIFDERDKMKGINF